MMTALQTLIFDLDGTLIDSAQAILSTFDAVLAARRIAPCQPLERSLIGPPLKQTLMTLTGSRDEDLLNLLVADFKTIYDNETYRQSRAFPGIEASLHQLVARGLKLHLATNKRIVPTRLILEHFGWAPLFVSVCSPDSVHPPSVSKGETLSRQLAEQRIVPGTAAYVGDTEADALAASSVELKFWLAAWGYGAPEALAAHWRVIHTPQQLIAEIGQL